MLFQLDHIFFSYGDKPVIKGISIDLEQGVFYGIVGPNGCGKSTLVDLLTGHRPPSAGSIKYRGQPIRSYSKNQLAQEIAMVPQDFYIRFAYTAEEIVMMGRYPNIPRFARPSVTDKQIIKDIMHATETHPLRKRFITELSGGERQRVVFARALAQTTNVLILDEATSNMDVNHSLGLMGLAAQGVAGQDKTVIAVFQDINLAASYCDHLLMMKAGRIAAQGRLADVLTPQSLKMVFGVEAKVYWDDFSQSNQVVFKL